VFKALGDSRRRRMLDLMMVAPRTTGEICDHFPELDRCTVMQHLAVLEDAELVIAQRRGRYRWNYLNPVPIRDIHDRWIDRYATRAVDLLARLKRDLESEPAASTSTGRVVASKHSTP
jgi:DNA-binding transcriptional ArsR family regulator